MEEVVKRRQWGKWTLGFLILAFVSLMTAQAIGHWTIGTLGSLIFGFVGASYSTYRGVKDLRRYGFLPRSSDRDDQS